MRAGRRSHSHGEASRRPASRNPAGWARFAVWIFLAFAFVLALPGTDPAFAQDPTTGRGVRGVPAPKSFPEQEGGIFGNLQQPNKTQPLYLQGDQLIYDTAGNKVIARGNVEIFYDNYILTADEVAYDQSASTLTAAGNVVVKEPNGNVIRADRYTLTDDFRDGFVQSLSVVARDDTRIAAERGTRREGNVTEFQNARFTPCKTEGGAPPLWCLSAARITHDEAAATISYQDAQFEFFGVPILYLPYFEHADPSVKRKSGFLMPDGGSSTNFGVFAEIPYYYALAPNYDLTFHPLYMSRQGTLWQADWRHRLANGQYSVKLAAIDQDASDLPSDIGNRPDVDGWRGSVETKGLFSLSSWWRFGWDATIESDDSFRRFYGLDSILVTDRVNKAFLIGQSDRSYFEASLYHFGGLRFEDTPRAESRAHPVIDHNYVFEEPVLGGELSWNSNFLSFSRDENLITATGQRFDQNVTRAVTELKWRRRLTDMVGITYTPFANLRGDAYRFEDFVDPESPLAAPVLVPEETVVRGLAEGGATVSYPWVANSSSASHIIEPIGQIVTRQASVTQRRLPNEDAQSLVFDDTNLFDTQKFSGYDRIETGTRLNTGVQYTFQAYNGGYARLLAGQSFHLSGDNVYAGPGRDERGEPLYTPESGLASDKSDYVVGAYLAPTDAFRLISQARFDEDDLTLRRNDVGAQVTAGPLRFATTYSYSATDPEVGDITTLQEIYTSAQLALTNYWSVGGWVRYDIEASRLNEEAFQIRYGDDCFVLTATYSAYHYEDPDIEEDRSLMLRFEFKHLGEYRYKTDALDYVAGEQPTR